MKKIMIALFAVATAICANAAAVDWKISESATEYKTGTWNVFAFVNTSVADLQAICESKNATAWEALGTAANTLSKRGAATGSTVGFESGKSATLTFVFVDGNIEDGASYVISTAYDVAGNVYEGAQTPTVFNTAVTGNIAQSGTFTAQSVPEPTSALMLLLGMAGLALKRKVA